MHWLFQLARLLLGLIFLTFGLNGFYTFIPVPEFHPFMQMLVDSGYIYVVKAIEVGGGILLLTNFKVPVALLLLGPIVVNIVLYHIFFDPRNWPISVLNAVLYMMVLFKYRSLFRLLVDNATTLTSSKKQLL